MADDVLTLLVHRGKRQIREDAADGTVPADARDLGTLHDFVDANGYTALDPWEGFAWEPRVWEQWERFNDGRWEGWEGPRYPWIGTAADAIHVWLKVWGIDHLPTRPGRNGPMFEVFLKRRGQRGIWYPVASSAEATAAVRRFITEDAGEMIGSSEWQGGSVRRQDEHKPFAHVSYNGRVWRYSPSGNHTEPTTFGPPTAAVRKA